MPRLAQAIFAAFLQCLFLAPLSVDCSAAGDAEEVGIRELFRTEVRPFLQQYCLGCHGKQKQEAKLDLSGYTTIASVTRDIPHWEIVRKRLTAKEMPPDDAKIQPSATARQTMIDWISRMRRRAADRNAGDPGIVLARRLSNAEYDYTIHDLTGVDIRPTREFRVDPANKAGFANSGESLAMSPALLKTYLGAARHVADHLVLTPTGIEFAPHPAVTASDRDKYCVHRVVNFYKRQPVDYADYFFAAWKYKHRQRLQKPNVTLADFAAAEKVSPKYLAMVWEVLADGKDNAGPLAALRGMWEKLPAVDKDNAEAIRAGCVNNSGCVWMMQAVTAAADCCRCRCF